MNSSMHHIVFVAADCEQRGPIASSEEYRAVQHALASIRSGTRLLLTPLLAARPLDLHRALQEAVPDILHISSHGEDGGGLVLRGEYQQEQRIDGPLLARFLDSSRMRLRLVVLNACRSLSTAETIRSHADVVIAMEGPVDTRAAVCFAEALYHALCRRKTFQHAFELAVAAMAICELPEIANPHILCRDGFEPDKHTLFDASEESSLDTARPAVSIESVFSALLHVDAGNGQVDDFPEKAHDAQDAGAISLRVQEVASALALGNLVVVAGAGIAMEAGLPGPAQLIELLVRDMGRNGGKPADLRAIEAVLQREHFADALDRLAVQLGRHEFAHRVEAHLDDSLADVPKTARAIAELARSGLRGVVTLTLDRLLERAFGGAWPVLTASTGDLAQRRRFILKLRGTLHDRSTWTLTRSQREQRTRTATDASREPLAGLLTSRTLLFVGCDLLGEECADLMVLLGRLAASQPPRHFAILSGDDVGEYEFCRLESIGIFPVSGSGTPGQSAP